MLIQAGCCQPLHAAHRATAKLKCIHTLTRTITAASLPPSDCFPACRKAAKWAASTPTQALLLLCACYCSMLYRFIPLPWQVEAVLSTPQICEAFPLHTSYLAAALVARGTLGPRALQAARNLLLNGSMAGRPGEEGAVAAFLGRAAAALPAATLQQWVLDVLDAAKVYYVCGCGLG